MSRNSLGKDPLGDPGAVDIWQLQEAREEFASLLAKERTREVEWQRFFTECPHVLSMGLPIRLLPEDIVPLGRPGRTEPDLIFYPRHQPVRHQSYGVIELKRPDLPIVTRRRKNAITLSRSAATAVSQAEAYLADLKKGERVLQLREDSLFLGTSAWVFILMGLSTDRLTTVVSELVSKPFRSLLPPNFQIIPYDHLFRMFDASVPPRFLVAVPALELEEAAVKDDEEDGDDWEWGYFGPSHDDAYEDDY